MNDLFTEEWLTRFSRKWNNDAEIVSQLAAANFDSRVCFGYTEAAQPEVLIDIQHGSVKNAKRYDPLTDQKPDWDLRAHPEQWLKWRGNGPGIAGLGMAVASRQLQFLAGDYHRMIRQPLLAGPFLKFFSFL